MGQLLDLTCSHKSQPQAAPHRHTSGGIPFLALPSASYIRSHTVNPITKFLHFFHSDDGMY